MSGSLKAMPAFGSICGFYRCLQDQVQGLRQDKWQCASSSYACFIPSRAKKCETHFLEQTGPMGRILRTDMGTDKNRYLGILEPHRGQIGTARP
ncbi:hypothetical protein RhiirC2_795805 [Rhizophagus irregularis]|uniref:Uncharacterized protein n=1 Tax=Rhizophagus irregularis TaxID=588596 RepID=A0A2N1MAV0_9GLOM|nr:hypothetical protein RhiirC2_795805 [Rhizophagus irregularis]